MIYHRYSRIDTFEIGDGVAPCGCGADEESEAIDQHLSSLGECAAARLLAPFTGRGHGGVGESFLAYRRDKKLFFYRVD